MATINELEPKRVLHYFEVISSIPHASYNTRPIVDYLEEFAQKHTLTYQRDKNDNIVIYKNATPGYEASKTLILQGHSDMVAEKNATSNHDFATEGLELMIEGDYLKANGTTLGGDDGIAVAICLAVLEDDALMHPALEVLITSNEEVGLLGATQFDTSYLRGTRLINLDSEEEGVLLAGCAGGVSLSSLLLGEHRQDSNTQFEIVIKGLKGGHSGMEIDKNRANANALMGRLLHTIDGQMDYTIAQLSGGEKVNVITSSAQVLILAGDNDEELLNVISTALQNELRKEYQGSDDGIAIEVKRLGAGTRTVFDDKLKEKTIFFLRNVPFGVHKMSGKIPGLVETSSNIGAVKTIPRGIEIVCSVRSMVGSAKTALAEQIKYLTEFLGGEYQTAGEYPAWEYQEVSPLRDVMVDTYQSVFNSKMKVAAIHAGLECGIFYDKITDLDCVSVGPNIFDVHSPNEKMSISSIERTWKYLLQVLEALK